MSLFSRSIIRRVFLAAGLGLLSLSVAAAQPFGPFNPNRTGQVWGTWVWQTQIAPGVTLPALITFNVDGTLVGADGTMFGGTAAATTRTTPLHGVWVRTGMRTIGGTSLYLIFSAAGVRIAWGRSRSSLEFAPNFDSFKGKMFVETLACDTGPTSCPDPTSNSAKWVAMTGMPVDGFPVTATRLEFVEAEPLK